MPRSVSLFRTALLCAPLVAGLILDGDKHVGAAPPFGREIEVARRAPHVLLDMGPSILGRLQPPLLLIRLNQEDAERTAVGAWAIERVVPGPVLAAPPAAGRCASANGRETPAAAAPPPARTCSPGALRARERRASARRPAR